MPKSDEERQHDACVAQVMREPEKFFCGDFIAGEKIYARAEPRSFRWGRKRVDGLMVFQTPSTFEIIAFELKLGLRQIKIGWGQLETVVDFFSDGRQWPEWAKDMFGPVAESHEVWLTTELLVARESGIEAWNWFPDYLGPKRKYIGPWPYVRQSGITLGEGARIKTRR